MPGNCLPSSQVGELVVGAPLRVDDVAQALRVVGQRAGGLEAGAQRDRDDGQRDQHFDQREAAPAARRGVWRGASLHRHERPEAVGGQHEVAFAQAQHDALRRPINGSGPSISARAPMTSALTSLASQRVGSGSPPTVPTKRNWRDRRASDGELQAQRARPRRAIAIVRPPAAPPSAPPRGRAGLRAGSRSDSVTSTGGDGDQRHHDHQLDQREAARTCAGSQPGERAIEGAARARGGANDLLPGADVGVRCLRRRAGRRHRS